MIAIVLRDYDAAFRCHSNFHLFYDWAVDIQIWALLTRSQCKVSDSQVTVKARGPLVLSVNTLLSETKICCLYFKPCNRVGLLTHFSNLWKLMNLSIQEYTQQTFTIDLRLFRILRFLVIPSSKVKSQPWSDMLSISLQVYQYLKQYRREFSEE
mgnify:CR=1 FL=1